jgi:hypothetical protein
MISGELLIHWEVEKMVMPGLSQIAKTKMLGFSSNVRDKIKRKQLWEDQLVGYMGQMIVVQHLTGSNELFYRDVEELGSSPVGDGGSDVLGARVDVKTSLMRHSPDWHKYNLLVRPKEFHADTVYVQNLVYSYSDEGAFGVIVGWLYADEIRGRCVKNEKRFGDAYCVPVTNLHPFMNCRWERQ